MSEPLYSFGWPADGPRLAALVLAVVVALVLPARLRAGRAARATIVAASAAAFGLSVAYVYGYLGGGPRIIDATSYWLQARALADGWLAWPLSEPEHAVLGRFLLRTPHALGMGGTNAGPGAAVIFPPGYPAVLALGFLAGAPLLVGPLLAAALVVATANLAGQVERAVAQAGLGVEGAARGARAWGAAPMAAVMSALCAALRYHTADTMAHGLAALCFTVGLSAAISLARRPRPAEADPPDSPLHRLGVAVVLGLAGGWLWATRPASALALLATVAALWLAAARRGGMAARPLRLVAGVLLGATPGLALWLLHQYAATGDLTSTAQAAYYAVSDGPPGCFAYGFGPDVGCRGEHGTFVSHRLAQGYGVVEALGTTARRLEMHVADPFNFAPLFWLVLLGGWWCRRAPAARALALAVVVQMVCYAPFYFDGNYPGGGARMLADVLPVEHALGALALGCLAARAPRRRPTLRQLFAATLCLSLVGFAFQTGRAHAQLASREGGRPMFEPSAVGTAQGDDVLLFVDTDHGFNLAYRPRPGPTRVARYHGDSLDRLAWEAAGRPRALLYQFDFSGQQAPQATPLPFDPAPSADLPLRIEGESLWPPAEQGRGWVWPRHAADRCASGERWLVLTPHRGSAVARLRLPAAALAGRAVKAVVSRLPSGPADGEPPSVTLLADGRKSAEWTLPTVAPCAELGPSRLPRRLESLQIKVQSSVAVAIDRIDASPLHDPRMIRAAPR